MGALTNKPMAFNSRNWEYNSQLTYDLTDFLTPRIRVDQFNGKVYRVLPTVEWISNRIRFLYLGLRNQRINTPITNYKILITINLKQLTQIFEKKIILSINYERAFSFLKARLSLNREKNINIIHGGVFDADSNIFNIFETKLTKVKNYLDGFNNFQVKKLMNFDNCSSMVFWGVNPRMESPLLNLKFKELALADTNFYFYSVGNFSFSFPVETITNNSSFFISLKKGLLLLEKSVLVFGLSSLFFSNKSFNNYEKINLVPIYLLNNNLENQYQCEKIGFNRSRYDVNVNLLSQNFLDIRHGFNFVVSSHFEYKENNIIMPVSGYLETNFKYYDSDLQIRKINSLKPNFGISDLLVAFRLYMLNDGKKQKKASEILFFDLSKKKIYNSLINNAIPNYLIRDPLGRANPLFKNH